jgi:hypothetical protein
MTVPPVTESGAGAGAEVVIGGVPELVVAVVLVALVVVVVLGVSVGGVVAAGGTCVSFIGVSEVIDAAESPSPSVAP